MYLPNDIERQLPHHEMIFVEGGKFLMGNDDEDAYSEEEDAYGDEQPIQEVQVFSFYFAKYPVTQALWKAVMGGHQNRSYFRGDDRPVDQVSWKEARDFIEKLNHLTGRKTYRLPSEAEWEYAARGGIFGKGYKYAGSDRLGEVGWYSGNNHGETKSVGQKDPNELGLYDLSGNVFEWIQDHWHSNYEGRPLDGSAWEDQAEGAYRVLRGGAWGESTQYCRVSSSDGGSPSSGGGDVGFRLACSLQSDG